MLKSRVLFVAVGQAGSNITKEFENLGYNVFYINTSYDDLKPLETDDNKVYHIKNAQGCAGNRDKAINYAIDCYDEMMQEIDTRYPTCDIVYICFSCGGGTGSGIAPILLDLISTKNPNKYYGAVAILPHKSESILKHSNARENIKQLISIKDKLSSIHLLDNNKREDYLDINIEFSQLFDRFVEFNETSQKGNIDGEELEILSTSNGNSVILEFESSEFKVDLAKAINDSIYADWNSDCSNLGVILEEGNSKIECLESIYEHFGMPITDFTTFSKGQTLIIATGMSFNTAIPNQLAIVAKEKLKKKQEMEANKVNDTEEDDVELDFKLKNKNLSNKRKRDNTNISKELLNIIDRYKKI